MTTPAHNDDHYHSFVRRAVRILAAALGPVVARMMTDKGFDRYRDGDGVERPLSTLADTPDASDVLGVMRTHWREVFQPNFEHPRHLRVRQMVHAVISIRNRYVGDHLHAECDYEPYDALGEIARLLRQFSAGESARQVNELMGELGILMYGRPTAATPSAGGDNVILTRDALEMLLVDTVSQAVDRRLRSEPDRADLRLLEGDAPPPTPSTATALPPPTVPLVGASSDIDVAPTAVPASAVGDAALVSAENVRLAEDAFSRGAACAEQGEYDQAIADFTAAIELNPHLAEAYYNRGVVFYVEAEGGYDRGVEHYGQGEYEHAITDFTSAIELNPQYAEAYYNRGLAYVGRREYDQAIADYTAAIDLNPQDAEAYRNRGHAYRVEREYDQATADYTAVIDLNPQDAEAYRYRGLAYVGRREYDQAIADYTAAIGLNPQDAEAYRYRGLAHQVQGEYDQVIRDYTAVIGLNPQDANAYLVRSVGYARLGEYERAIEDIDRASAMSPDVGYKGFRDWIIRLRGDSAEYDQAIADDPDDPENWHLRGLYYSEREEYGRAVDDYTKALELVTGDGNAAEIYSDRGLAWARLGDDERAMADFDRAIDANPNLAEAWYNRGLTWARLGDDERAMADFDRAIEGNPNLAEEWYNRGLAWRRRGEHGNAVLDFTRAIEVRPDYALAYYGRSISHGVLGNGEQAAADFERARELGFEA